jgi:hypothetical protein
MEVYHKNLFSVFGKKIMDREIENFIAFLGDGDQR